MSCEHEEVYVVQEHTNIDPQTLLCDTRIVGYECAGCGESLPPDHFE